ncbi:hypothetical protein [Alteribacillus bidgolensis]|uniref:Fe3+ hydroxamate ABC transporter substrate-binding protein n=1 Tax=Alteribacillus bidgolensis TaxID=930129 RepID=A0A1G8NNG6_9BACI|nr:hypothetical protein [Alteribacillus bidgolensis]SDI81715.1 hypothetical protein SAMN05216352_11293 [Alteribacillus bidgolensis]
MNRIFKRKTAACANCGKKIETGEEIYAKMRYPKRKIMVEIKAYLIKETEIFCSTCFKQEKGK